MHIPVHSPLKRRLVFWVSVLALAFIGAGDLPAQTPMRFSWKYVPRSLGAASRYGHVIWHMPLATLTLDGQSVPLIMQFSSDPRPLPAPSPFGRGWTVNLFCSALVEVSQNSLRWHRPDGRTFYLVRERGNSAASKRGSGEPVRYLARDGTWTAERLPGKRFITLKHPKSGAELVYEEGLLVRFAFADPAKGAERFALSHNRLRRPTRLSSVDSGKLLAEFIYDTAERAQALRILPPSAATEPILIEFEYAEAPLNHFESGPYLSHVGDTALTPLSLSYATEGTQANHIRIQKANEGSATTLIWEAHSGFIRDDGGARYQIETPSLANGGRPAPDPNAKPSPSKQVIPYNWQADPAKITRIDRDGKSEYKFYDRRKGIATHRTKDGITTAKYYLLSSGPMYNKIRKIEETRNGQTTVLERNAYDELGRIVRKIDTKGSMSIWEYLDGGKQVRKITDGQIVQEITYESGRLVNNKTFSGGNLSEYIITYGDSGRTVVFQENGEKRWEKVYKEGIGLERFETFGPTKRLWTYSKDALAKLPANNAKP